MTDYPVDMTISPVVTPFFDADSNTFTYVVKDPNSNACAIIDSVLDIDYASGRITYDHADKIIDFITENNFELVLQIETHVHADHLSAAPYIQEKLGGDITVGEGIKVVQDTFGKVFNEGTEFQRDGSQFDRLFKDGDTYTIGTMPVTVMHTPGHTPACMTHIIGDTTFVGDTLFMPDSGSARADFPGGDAGQLYDSVKKIMSLPDDMKLMMCHDYGPNGRDIQNETTVKEQKDLNIHFGGSTSREDFVKMREERDATLAMPRLIIPSLQVNMRAGEMPPADADGKAYFKVPINQL